MRKLPRALLIASISVGGLALPTAVHGQPDGRGGYVVERGDYLFGIARELGVPIAQLLRANGLTLTSVIHPGQRLVIPGGQANAPTPSSPTTSPAPVTRAPSGTYTVRAGDSLWALSRRLGVSFSALLQANALTASSLILPGRRLTVPSTTGAPAPTPPAPPTTTPATTPPPTTRPPSRPSAPGTYIVQAGDSLWGISRRLGVSFSSLLGANGLTATSLILPGRSLVVPTGAGSAPPTAPPPTPPPSVTLTAGQVERIIREVWPDELEQTAVDIAWRESRLRPTAQNGCCVGLFQLYYDLHSWWLAGTGVGSRNALLDARTNARAALTLYGMAGWTPWTYTPPTTSTAVP